MATAKKSSKANKVNSAFKTSTKAETNASVTQRKADIAKGALPKINKNIERAMAGQRKAASSFKSARKEGGAANAFMRATTGRSSAESKAEKEYVAYAKARKGQQQLKGRVVQAISDRQRTASRAKTVLKNQKKG
jgi:hypothetical protein